MEWFFPKRLTIDTNGADQMKRNDVARFLGLRLEHTRQIDVPIYAFETTLTDGDVLRGAKRLVKRAKTTRAPVDAGRGRAAGRATSIRSPRPRDRNEFLKTLVAFLGCARLEARYLRRPLTTVGLRPTRTR